MLDALVCCYIIVANVRHDDAMFDALAAGGQLAMPMGKTFFSPRFGMLADKFGVHWMILVAH